MGEYEGKEDVVSMTEQEWLEEAEKNGNKIDEESEAKEEGEYLGLNKMGGKHTVHFVYIGQKNSPVAKIPLELSQGIIKTPLLTRNIGKYFVVTSGEYLRENDKF